MTDTASLRLAVEAGDVEKATRLLDLFTRGSGQAATAANQLTITTGALATAAKGLAAAYASFKVAEHIREMALLAARYETLGVVMRVAGNNAGYTNAQMLEFQKGLEKTGISMSQSRDVLIKMASAQISLADSTKIARAAQDLAVVGNINSSEALVRMTEAIQSGEQEILKTMGLNVQWEAGYVKMALQLHKNKDALTEHEKIMSRTNTVLQGATAFNGIYEESLGTAGKALSSLTRYWDNLKTKMGEAFLPALSMAVNDLTDALKLANAELDHAGSAGVISSIGQGLAQAFKTAYEAVVVLGANVLFTLSMVAGELTTIATQAVALAHLDFKGVKEIGEAWVTESTAARKAVDAFSDSVVNGTKVTTAATDAGYKQATMTEEQRMVLGKYTRDKQEADAKAAKAAADLLAAQKAILEARLAMIQQAAEAEKAQRSELLDTVAELNRQGLVSDAAYYTVRYNDAVEAGAAQARVLQAEINAAHQFHAKDYTERVENAAKIAKLEAQKTEVLRAAGAAATKITLAYSFDREKGVRDAQEASVKEISAINDAVEAMQRKITAYGKLESAVTRQAIADLEERKAALEMFGGADNIVAGIDARIEALHRLGDAQEKFEGMEKWAGIWKSIDQTAHDTFVSIFNNGKNAFDRLRDTLKAGLLDLLYQMTVKKWIFQIGANVSSGAGIAGMFGGGTSGGATESNSNSPMGVVSLLSAAKSAYSAISSGFADVGTSVTNGVQTAMNAWQGSSSAAAQGMYGPTATGGNIATSSSATMAGTAASYAAGMSAGKLAGSAISGQYGIGDHGSAVVNIGTAIGAIWGPLGAAIGGAIGGLVNRAFGMGSKDIQSRGIEGNFGKDGFSGNTFANWHQDGGWFRSDKNGHETATLNTATHDQLVSGFNSLKSVSAEFAKSLGLSADTITGYNKKISLELTEDAAKNQEAITGLFTGMGEDMAKSVLTGVSTSVKEVAQGITVSWADLAKKTGEYTLSTQNGVLKFLKTVSEVTGPDYSYVLRENETYSAALQRLSVSLSAANGMLDTLNSKLLDASVAGGVAASSLAGLFGGLEAMKATSASYFQNYYTEQEKTDIATRQLAKTFADLGYVMPTATKAGKEELRRQIEAQDLTTEAGRKTYAQLMSLSGAFAGLTASAEQLAASSEKAAAAAKASEDTRQATEAARSAVVEAYNRESDALKSVIDQAQAAAKALRAYGNSLLLGSSSVLSPEDKYAEAKRQFDAATPENLQAASSALLDASKGYFASSEGYAKDFAMVQAKIAISAAAATATATIAQQQLSSLNSSVSGIMQVNTSVLSVRDALVAYKAAMSGGATSGGGGIGATTGAGSGGHISRNADGSATYYGPTGGTHNVAGVNGYNLLVNAYPNAQRFALGAVFTNGVVSQPTHFNIGQMGEKDPEAIMPLVRTPQGLGVRSVGGDNQAVAGLLREVLAELKNVTTELGADKVQRGAAALATLEKLDRVADKLDGNKRELARAS